LCLPPKPAPDERAIPRGSPRVVRATIRHEHSVKFRVEDLNLDDQFLKPPPVQKHRVGARPMTRHHRLLLDGCGLRHAPRALL
jgi:hypothetical protein